MKLHPRHIIVETARREMEEAIESLYQKHGLTWLEMVSMLNDKIGSLLKYARRDEDEAKGGKSK